MAAVIEEHAGILVVRDDLLRGGSKTRFLPHLITGTGHTEVVYGGPFCGGAALALSALGSSLGFRVTLFYAKRKERHRRQLQAEGNGARIVEVPFGYMSNVQAKAKAYAKNVGALFLPLGFDVPAAVTPFVRDIRGVLAEAEHRAGELREVWCATGSGMLARCIATAAPAVKVKAVAVGLRSRWSRQVFPENVEIIDAAVPFERESRAACPFPCDPNYDRKAWALACSRATRPALFWNVLG